VVLALLLQNQGKTYRITHLALRGQAQLTVNLQITRRENRQLVDHFVIYLLVILLMLLLDRLFLGRLFLLGRS
jgi:hypothetical protein